MPNYRLLRVSESRRHPQMGAALGEFSSLSQWRRNRVPQHADTGAAGKQETPYRRVQLNLPEEAAEFPTAECRAKQPRRDQGGDDESESHP